MRRTAALLIAATLALTGLPALAAPQPIHLYLMDDASDVYGGPALTGLGGSFGVAQSGAVGYQFGAQQGLSLSGALPTSVYTLDFTFSFSSLSGYRRLVDFKNLASDAGLYSLNAALNFYPVVTGSSAAFDTDTLARVTLTRDAAGLVSGYVNGALAISFSDSGNLATFSGPGAVAYFFRDDNAVGGEASAGFVDYLRVYDVSLSAAEVAALPSPVPEPAAALLMLAGLGGLGGLLAARRRA
jgi:Concanavalin A-like lectin/glucanases superfamily/PEP-CTERM motif